MIDKVRVLLLIFGMLFDKSIPIKYIFSSGKMNKSPEVI